MIRLLLVEDSVTQREILRRLFEADEEFTVVAEAKNGAEAIELTEKHRPDVVLMDIHMPGVNGVTATREIMQRCPVPIVVASASLKQEDVDLGLTALRAGAVAVIEKPQGAVLLHLSKMGPQLRRELIAASKARVSRIPQPRPRTVEPMIQNLAAIDHCDIVGICASTGGPPVLMNVLSRLPKPYPLPILLVQHISPGFVEGFARWLSDSTGQPVSLAESGQPLGPGVWISPGEKHLLVTADQRIELQEAGEGDIHCPSGNPLFSSLAQHYGSHALGIVLTGMGDDGAVGLKELRSMGGRTLCQSEESSLIWGMPGAAHRLGATEADLDPEQIAGILLNLAEARQHN